MYRGPAGGLLAVVGGVESPVWTLVANGSDRGTSGARECCPLLVGGWFGDLGEMVLAVVLLALFGLALVALSHSEVTTLSRHERGDTRDPEPDTAIEPETTDEPDANVDGVATDDDEERATGRERTDREAIIAMLRANDGRMRQAAIVQGTDWSKSKVSMVLTEMEERGEISKLRVGRENIVSLQGNEPEAAGSPFEEE